MTILRHPFQRAISAFFYRGHSPNYDVFDLRPGLWLKPWIRRADTTLAEYLTLSEYADVATKMFGATCRQDERCASSTTCACSATAKCHAYRNASLDEASLDLAFGNLQTHAVFALQEAYNTSVLLAAKTFDLDLDASDFEPDRASVSLTKKCSPSKVMRLDPHACRAAFAGHAFDVRLYERAHRAFCDRLDKADLVSHPVVRAELQAKRLCGDTHFDNADHVCGPLETLANVRQLDKLRRLCGKTKNTPGWWMAKHGFFATESNFSLFATHPP